MEITLPCWTRSFREASAERVKKLSEQRRRYLRRKSLAGTARRRGLHARGQRSHVAREEFLSLRQSLPAISMSVTAVPGYSAFQPPARFSIYDNFEETLAFLLDFRSLFLLRRRQHRGRRPPLYANFSVIEYLDAASGLLLAAEIDRWRRTVNVRPNPFDHLWHEDVRDFFHDAGLFELLGIDARSTRSTVASGPRRQSLRFQTGTFHEGATADRFRSSLEELIGQPIGPRRRVYDAMSEAMTNVAHHAYPRDIELWPAPSRGRWWLGGSWLPDARIATVQIYDQGVGIPRTLPRSRHWSEVLPILGRIDRERTDAGMIEAAMDYGRTSTGQAGRGKGLAQMAEWISEAGNGSLRILSGKGSLTYLPGKRPIRRQLPVEFRGTLVEWEVHL